MLYSFGGDTQMTPEQIKRRREFAQLLMDKNLAQPKNVPEGLNAIARALVARGTRRMTDKAEETNRSEFARKFGSLFGGGGYGGSGGYGTPANPPSPYDAMYPTGQEGPAPEADGVSVKGQNYAFGQEADPEWERIQAGIFAGESGGDYDALFGFSQRPGKKFEGVKPTQMTVGEVLQLQDPSGQYGQWVKGQVGRVATPVGAYQIVGTTLRDAVRNGVVSPDEQFSPEVQDRVGKWILSTQGTGAWEGYRGPQEPGSVQVAQAGGGFDIGTMAELAASPYASEGQKLVLQALIDRQLQASDPMYRLSLENQQLQNEALRNPQPKPTAGQREYEMAVQQGYEGSFMDYKRDLAEAQRAQTNVNVNTGEGPRPEPLGTKGQILVPDPSQPSGYRVEIAPNSELAMEQEQLAQTEANKASAQATASDVVVNAATRALGAARNRDVGGLLGAAAAFNPSSNNAELYRQVSSLKSIASAEALNAMRRQSPTGGALGNVTEKELKLLSEQAGALDPMSPNFERDLRDYTQTMLRTVHGKEAGDAIFEAQLREAFKPRAKTEADAPPSSQDAPTAAPTMQDWRGPSPTEIRRMSRMEREAMVSAYKANEIPDEILDLLIELQERDGGR